VARRPDVAWGRYLREFHAEEPGITERVLRRCRHGGLDPYGWLLQGVDPASTVLDVGCGNGAARPPGASAWVGVDPSVEELQRGAAEGRTALVRADARRLPCADGSIDAVTAAMSLMLVDPVERALAEIARVLRPGGTLHALLPTSGPLTAGDVWRYGRVFLALRATSSFPSTPLARRAAALVEDAGLELLIDERARFAYEVAEPADGEDLVRSLYLPGVAEQRRTAGRRRAAALAPTTIGIPLRRVVARRVRT
jgi:SAM-dependent methyltransferase